MPLRVSIAQAVLNACAAYLGGAMTDTTVRARWAQATTKKAPRDITIIRVGDVDYLGTGVFPASTTVVGAKTVQTVWAVFNCTMPVQLDVWATAEVQRDDMIARLEELLNAGNSVVRPDTADPVGEGVVVALGDGLTGTAEFVFAAPRPFDTSDSVQRSEYRASATGIANFVLTITTTDPRLITIKLKTLIHQELSAPSTLPVDSVVISASGTTYTSGP